MEITEDEYQFIKTALKDKNAEIGDLRWQIGYYQNLYEEAIDRYDCLRDYIERWLPNLEEILEEAGL